MTRMLKTAAVLVATISVILAGTARAATLVEQAVPASALAAGSSLINVEGKGVITAVTGTCPAVVLTISGIPVTVDANTVFAVGQTCGQLAANQQIQVRGVLTVTGTTLSVVEQRIGSGNSCRVQ